MNHLRVHHVLLAQSISEVDVYKQYLSLVLVVIGTHAL
jgi:hypothetical protein